MSPVRPVYIGNYEYDARRAELEREFRQFGPIEHIDFRFGFCYVIFKDQRDAEECVRQLDGREWGRMSRRFRVRFAWDGDARVRQAARRRDAEPSTKLFVAGYDARTTKASDLEVLFEEFGRIRRCDAKENFAFIEFETMDDAKSAFDAMHGRRLDGHELTVEYALGNFEGGARHEGDRGGRWEGRDRRPMRGHYDRRSDGDRMDRGQMRRGFDSGSLPHGRRDGGFRQYRSRSRSFERNRYPRKSWSPVHDRSGSPRSRRGSREQYPRRRFRDDEHRHFRRKMDIDRERERSPIGGGRSQETRRFRSASPADS